MKMGFELDVLRAFNANFPVLYDWGYTLNRPVALVFENFTEAISIIQKTSVRPSIIDASTKVETAKKCLAEANSDGVFLFVSSVGELKSVKTREKIEAIFSAATIQKVDSKPVCAATYLVFAKAVPDEFRERVFEIHFSKHSEYREDEILDLVPSPQQLSVVEDRIKNIQEANATIKFWKVVVAFLYPRLSELGRREEYENLIALTEKMVKMAEIYQEEGNIVEVFTDCLIAFFNEFDAPQCYRLPHLDSEAELLLQEAIYMKENQIFLNEKLFRGVAKALVEYVPLDFVKESLAKQGVLQADAGGYTTKMSYFDQTGQLHRVRMMKLNIEKLGEKITRLVRSMEMTIC